MAAVFISYSRLDKDFVRRLGDELLAHKREAWVDWKDIPLTAEWQQEIFSNIEAADNFIFIISSDSIASMNCKKEIDHAVANHKRMVPIFYRPVPDDEIPDTLGRFQRLDFNDSSQFETKFETLIKALDTDLPWTQTHTRLLTRAKEWEREGKDRSFLLHGKDLGEAEQWMAKSADHEPKPTALQSQYILASRQSATKAQRIVIAAVAVALVVAIGLAIYALVKRNDALRETVIANDNAAEATRQRNTALTNEAEAKKQEGIAKEQRDLAEEQRTRAERERTAAEAKSLALAAERDFGAGRQTQALIEAVQGGRKLESLSGNNASFAKYPTVEPISALSRVLDRVRERNRLEHHEDSYSLQNGAGVTNSGPCSIVEPTSPADVQHLMSQGGRILAKGCTPNGRYLVTTATDGTVRVLDTTGPRQSDLVGLQGGATRLSFAPDSLHFTTTDVWGTVVDWDLSGANRRRSAAVLSGHKAVVTAIAFAREAPLLATGSGNGEIRLWTITGRQLGNSISTGKASVVALQLSPDGTTIGSITSDGVIQSWDQLGKHMASLASSGTSSPGRTCATFSTSIGHDIIIDAVFRRDGLAAATAIAGGASCVYDLAGRKCAFVHGQHRGWIMGVAFNSTGKIVATAGADDTVAFSDLSGEPFSRPIRTSQGQVMSVAFSPDEQLLATGGDDGTVKLWTPSGAEAGKLIGHQGKVLHVGFASDGQLIATSSSDGTVRLWLRNGEQLTQYEGYRGFLAEEALGGSFGTTGVSLSPDGRMMAIAESAGTVQIWHVQTLGELMEQACIWLEPYLTSHPDAPRVCSGR